MANSQRATARLAAVASFLEEEFPGRVEEAAEDNIFIISYRGVLHHVVLEPTFMKQCPDYIRALRDSEVVDYLRETREQSRRFLVSWAERDTRIRSAPL